MARYRLTENRLRSMIREAVKGVLNEDTYIDAEGEEWDEASIQAEIETIFEDYYAYRKLSKRDVIETLQWLKDMNAGSLISAYVNDTVRWYNKCEQDLLNLYNSL